MKTKHITLRKVGPRINTEGITSEVLTEAKLLLAENLWNIKSKCFHLNCHMDGEMSENIYTSTVLLFYMVDLSVSTMTLTF